MTQEKEYIAMGFKLMPSGRINHHLWYGRKFGHSSITDATWRWSGHKVWGGKKIATGSHTCCGSKKAYCHRAGCKHRRELSAPDDLSDLKDL